MSDGECSDFDNYQVQAIIQRRNVGDKNQYLVKWKGYSESQNTWEPEQNLVSCQKKLEEFNKRKNIKKQQSSKSQTIIKPKPANKIIRQTKKDKSQSQLNSSSSDSSSSPNKCQEYNPNEQSKSTQKIYVGRYEIREPLTYVEGMYVDLHDNYWFNIMANGKRVTVSEQELKKRNIMALLLFYEENIITNIAGVQ